MIDFSGRATRAGTRGIAAAAAVSCFTIPPLASHDPARADGPAGPSARAHDHRPAGREHAPGGSEHGFADGEHGPAAGRHEDRSARPERDRDATERDRRPTRGTHDRKGWNEHLPPRPRIILDTRAPHGAVVPGRTYTWPYSVRNTGSAPVRNVTLTTTPNRDLKIITMPPKCGWHGRDLVCRIGLLPARQARNGGFTARVDPRTPTGRTLSSPARVSWDGRPGSAAREMAFPPVTASQPTDLAVTGDDLPETVRPGGEVPYEITVTNAGPVTAEAVVVRSSVADEPGAWPNDSAPAVPPCAAAQAQQAAAPRCGAEEGRPACDACAVRRPDETGATADRQEAPRPAAGAPAAGQACGACAVRQPVTGGATADRQDARPPAADTPAAGTACDACAGRQSAQACGACAGRQDAPACGSVTDGAGALTGRPAVPTCASSPARVAAAPGKEAPAGSGIHRDGPAEAPIGPGIAPERPAPSGDTPIVIGKDHHCLTQGSGFVCPLGAIPPGRTRKLRLTVRARPHARPGRLRCLNTVTSGTPDENPANNSVACHTRNARPMPARPVPGVRRLPHTGFPYGTVALAGLGFAALGLLLVWIGRARRGEEV
ncbi:hypothetical protein NE235_08625 [Actinoallomurus spadix]|uniref:DUF11 domain-containing protein n=1 Tax=Actinoallomurus spadix TaxID=79912 RepID=A0ABP3FW74_9ACTN|nr:hypothetical protein [Actinoallomurus spadix]MCO5986171.1 hypothetical protein [Actinoallomurus spadix]